MKIAILTLYYKNYNYGGLLQAYALQKALELLGHEAMQISYILESGYVGWNPVKNKIKKSLMYLYHSVKYGVWFEDYQKRRLKLSEFADKIPHTTVVSARTISRLSDEYDCFICGSDQIWNPIGWQPTLFFDFLASGKKRIAYAASIARDSLTEQQIVFMKKYLKGFSAISVREKNLLAMLNKEFPELKINAMPDPVFLLSKVEWQSFIPHESNNEPYIFAYFLGANNENREKAIRYAESHDLKIRFASYVDLVQSTWEKMHQEVLSPILGIEDFLREIAYAKLVITDSFHAVAFSCILRTPFYALPRFKNTDISSMNSRIENLVEELGIQERLTVDLERKFIIEWSEDELNQLNTNLKILQNKGLKYLKVALN